jgi:RHS repeat-associated protein
MDIEATYTYDALPCVSQFTGKERDSETGLDYFGARYYASNMGRWMSPDWADKPETVPYSDLGDPQSLNLYGYVRNNPLSHADADGHCDGVGCIFQAIQVVKAFANNPSGFVSDLAKGFGKQIATNVRNNFTPPGGNQQTTPNFSNDVQRAGGDAVNPTLTTAAIVLPLAKGDALSNDALVVRGGTNLPENFSGGTGVTLDSAGKLQNVSVNSANGASVAELSVGIKNGQVGVTTAGQIREAGGTVEPSASGPNPNHCTMCGLTPQKASDLFRPTIPNPDKQW